MWWCATIGRTRTTFKRRHPKPVCLEQTDISGHRSGGGIEPEETLRAFKNCAENPDFSIDVFEFDLHVTKDDVLVLLHDDTVDRTSDSQQVFGEKDVRPENKTYDELRQLNMGAQFETESGEKPMRTCMGIRCRTICVFCGWRTRWIT